MFNRMLKRSQFKEQIKTSNLLLKNFFISQQKLKYKVYELNKIRIQEFYWYNTPRLAKDLFSIWESRGRVNKADGLRIIDSDI